MESPRSAEEIRKVELSLEELITKFQSRVQLVRDDLKSLILEIEQLKIYIGDLRRISNDRTRTISDLTNEHKALISQEEMLNQEIDSSSQQLTSVTNELQELQSSLNDKKSKVENLEAEKTSLNTILNKNINERDSLKTNYDKLEPIYDSKINRIQEELNRLKNDKEMLNYRFKSMRRLSESYLQTTEVNLIRFLARKPSPISTLVEIRSALGIDLSALSTILGKLAEREILEIDKNSETVNLKVKIDLFTQEE
ncbi:MAG: hypothetical protein ACXAB2_03240 [Candidatus Hodarchaeales archaeon]|jgi:chromosome segregation ATPase